MPREEKLPVLAVIGGIGSGKSVVARELARHGGHLIQGDELGHEALEQPEIRDRIVQEWGREILDEQGQIVRRKLGRIVFADTEALRRLESIVFPFIGRRIEEEREKANKIPGTRFIVLDAAVILEAGWSKELDRLIYVDAPPGVRLERLRARGWDEKEVAGREAAQMPLEEKKRRADAVVENDGDFSKMTAQARRLLQQWKLT